MRIFALSRKFDCTIIFLAVSSVLNVVFGFIFCDFPKNGNAWSSDCYHNFTGNCGDWLSVSSVWILQRDWACRNVFYTDCHFSWNKSCISYVFAPIIGVTAIWWAILSGWLLADTVGLIYYKMPPYHILTGKHFIQIEKS